MVKLVEIYKAAVGISLITYIKLNSNWSSVERLNCGSIDK
jgi:hypothetical protein